MAPGLKSICFRAIAGIVSILVLPTMVAAQTNGINVNEIKQNMLLVATRDIPLYGAAPTGGGTTYRLSPQIGQISSGSTVSVISIQTIVAPFGTMQVWINVVQKETHTSGWALAGNKNNQSCCFATGQ